MDLQLRRSLGESLADSIRDQIHSGRMGTRLPGVRLLAKTYGVSVPTVCKALHLLGGEGLLTGGGRHHWRIAESGIPRAGRKPKSGSGPEKNVRTARLLFLSTQPLGGEKFSGLEVFAELSDLLGSKGWEVIHRILPFNNRRKPRGTWNDLLKVTRPDAIIALSGTPELAKWIDGTGIRCLFLGGATDGTGIPVLAVSSGEMFREAVTRLVEMGHRSILAPFCDRQSGFVADCTRAMMEALEAAGLDRRTVVVAETPYARPDVVRNLLRRQWPRCRPDALLLVDWREFVAACAYLRENGLDIPRDLSVVILSHNSSMEWHIPPITHFELPVKRLAKVAAKWVTGGTLPKGGQGNRILIAPRWVEGGSVAARRTKPGA